MNTMVPNRPLYPVLIILTGVALAAAAFWFLWTLLLWYRLHPHLPWRDLFVVLDDILPLLRGEASWTGWKILIEPHYSAHRIAIPRLLVAMDLSFFGGQNHTLYTAAWLGILTCLGIYMGMARDYFRRDSLGWGFGLGVVTILFFAPAHLWNLMNAINASWHITFSCALISFFILLRGSSKPGPVAWVLAYGFATVAAFTTFAGVIVWLLLPVLALSSTRRTLILTATISLLLTLGYLNGISSDAEIATMWESKNIPVMSKMHAAGMEALAGNTPVVILHKAMNFLAWPMPSTWPAISLILVGLSFIIIAYFWLAFLVPQKLDREELHPWLKLSLLIATLALGIALATQLGRIIEQANHAHGPSFERYNTVVAVYWSGIFGLLLSLQNQMQDRHRIGLMATSLVLVFLLTMPGGKYLKQEILSVESAAILYAGGETPRLREKIEKRLIRFKPEYIYQFDAFFRKEKLAYNAPLQEIDQLKDPLICSAETIKMTVSRSRKKGFKEIEARLSWSIALQSRDILVFKGEKLVSRLYPKHEGDFSPLALLTPAYNHWHGHIKSGAARDHLLLVVVNTLGPTSIRCRIGNMLRDNRSLSLPSTSETPQDV